MRSEVIARIVNLEELEIRQFVPLPHVKALQSGHVVDVTAGRREFTARSACRSVNRCAEKRSWASSACSKARPGA